MYNVQLYSQSSCYNKYIIKYKYICHILYSINSKYYKVQID